MGKRILVITGGESVGQPANLASDRPYDLVIAADSGVDRAVALGMQPSIVVGDLDSASRSGLDMARSGGSEVDAHPAEKDHTDFALALQRAIQEGATEIAVIGGGGGRPDHWLANLGLMAAAANSGVAVSAEMDGWSLSVVIPGQPYAEELPPGRLVSLLPVGGDALGVSTKGLQYPLDHEELPSGTSRGVSNVAVGGYAQVEIEKGTLLVMRPNRNEVSP